MIKIANNNNIKDPLTAEGIIIILDSLSSQNKINNEYKNIFVG
jgi:hypothetical protein